MKEFEIYNNRPGIEIIFSDGIESLSLFYMIYEWDAASKFYDLISDAIKDKKSFISDTSFNITEQDKKKLIADINLLLELINQKYHLPHLEFNERTDLNLLHRHLTPVNCDLWRQVNDKIHAFEQFKTQITDEPRINAYFKFLTDKEYLLTPEDYMFFKVDRMFGDLCLNYTHKGKHWLELQSDDDIESVVDGQLQPETRIAPDGYMMFRPPAPSPMYRLNKFVNWYKKKFPNQNISYQMALGYLLVGKLVMPASWDQYYNAERNEWTRKLSKFKSITQIKLIKITQNLVPELLSQSQMI